MTQTTNDRIENFNGDMKACVYFNQNMADACNAGKALTVFPENFRKLPQTSGWRPFESLPKDGSRFLARLDEHQDITILHYEQVEFQDDGENYVPDKWITGWMPLPEWKS